MTPSLVPARLLPAAVHEVFIFGGGLHGGGKAAAPLGPRSIHPGARGVNQDAVPKAGAELADALLAYLLILNAQGETRAAWFARRGGGAPLTPL